MNTQLPWWNVPVPSFSIESDLVWTRYHDNMESNDYKRQPDFFQKVEKLREGDDLKTGGVKFDDGKFRWSLLPWEAARGVLAILEHGAKKYAARNWEKGMDWSRPFDACIRHMTAWWGGEDKDRDSGMPHLWHAACNLFFLITYGERKVGKDDRPGVRS